MEKNNDLLQCRLVSDIIIMVLEKIPGEEIKLIQCLRSYYGSLWNKSPEVLKCTDAWTPFLNILNSFIPVIHKDWHHKIYDIVKGDTF